MFPLVPFAMNDNARQYRRIPILDRHFQEPLNPLPLNNVPAVANQNHQPLIFYGGMNVMNNDDNHLRFFDGNVPQVEQEVDQPRLVKPRMKWTEELHERFVNAVVELGGPWEAKPRAIKRKMQVRALTLYHIKSHLQEQMKEVATKFQTMLPFEDQAGSSKSVPMLPHQFPSVVLAPAPVDVYIPQPPTEAADVHVPPEMEDMVAQSIAENSMEDFLRALELAP
ncbi:protein phr1-like 3 [Nicotiana attenuata]|uniref:Protein phr1-like 3 n=1 Tax=Nicotiana attenuata TaxID=49451 RepID=A0A314L2B6_NICAT|nr:protein phr1-like 3 [Nicotiana attenuata]